LIFCLKLVLFSKKNPFQSVLSVLPFVASFSKAEIADASLLRL
jgi:hypothetical protein